MFKRHTDWENQYWHQIKAAGRRRFIWRDEVLGSFFFWLILMPSLALFGHRQPFSATNVFIDLIILPIFLLGGYLSGVWRWKELDKKYPE
jgi:hypothetical protein